MNLGKLVFICCFLCVAFSYSINSKAYANLDQIRMFDSYFGNTSSRFERDHLNNLARFLLKEEPTFIAYIIAYNGKRFCKDEAIMRANRAKEYLLRRHQIATERIIIINGGFREDSMFDIYVFPKELTPPTALPTLERDQVVVTGNCKKKPKL